MNIVLRSYRFVRDDHAVLIIHECADRNRVLVEMESKDRDDEKESIFLSREEWHILHAFDPFNDGDSEIAASIMQTLSFTEDKDGYRTVLEVVEVADHDVVFVEMKRAGNDLPLYVRLNRTEWNHLFDLDLFDPPRESDPEEPVIPDDEPPSGQIH